MRDVPSIEYILPLASSAASGEAVVFWNQFGSYYGESTFSIIDADTNTVIVSNISSAISVPFNSGNFSTIDPNPGVNIAGVVGNFGIYMMYRIKNNTNFLPGNTYHIKIQALTNGATLESNIMSITLPAASTPAPLLTRLFTFKSFAPRFWFAIPGPSSVDGGSCVFVWENNLSFAPNDTITLFDNVTQTVIVENIPRVTNVLFSSYVGIDTADINPNIDIAGIRNAVSDTMLYRIKQNPKFLPGKTYTIGIGSSLYGQRPNSMTNYGTITVTLPPYIPQVSLYNVNTYLPNNLISANDAKAVLLWSQPSFSTNPSTSYTITNVSSGERLVALSPITDSPFTVSDWETNSYATDTATSSGGFIDENDKLCMMYRLDTTAPSTTSLIIVSTHTQPIQYIYYTNTPFVNNGTLTVLNLSNTVVVNVTAPSGLPSLPPGLGPAPAPFPSPEDGLAQDPIVLPSLDLTSLPTYNNLFPIRIVGPIINYAITGKSSLNYASCVFELQSPTGIPVNDTYIIKDNDTSQVIATFPHVTNIPYNYNGDIHGNLVDNNPTLDIASVYDFRQNMVMFRLKENSNFLPGRTYNLVIGSSIFGQNENYGSITVITPVYIPQVQLYSVENKLPSNLISTADPTCVLIWAQPRYTNMQFTEFIIRETSTNNVLATVEPKTDTIFDVVSWKSNAYSVDQDTNIAGFIDSIGTLWMMYRLTSTLTNTNILNLRIESKYSQQMYTSIITDAIKYSIISIKSQGASNIVNVDLTTTALTAATLYSVNNSLPSNLIMVSATETEAVLIWNQKLTLPNSADNITVYVIVNADTDEIIDSVVPVTDSTFDIAAWKTNEYTADTTTNVAGFIDTNNMNWMLYRIKQNSSFIRGAVYNIKIQTLSTSSTYSNVVRAVLPYATLPSVSIYNEQYNLPSNLISPTAGGAILIWSQFILNANDLLNIVSYNIIDVVTNNVIATVSPIINKPFNVDDWKSNPYITDLTQNSAGFIDGNTLWMMYRITEYSPWNYDNIYHIRIQTITVSATNIYSDYLRVQMPYSGAFNPVEIYANADGSLPANLISETGETLVIWKQPSFINSSKLITYDITVTPVVAADTTTQTPAAPTLTPISGTLLNKTLYGPRLVAAIPGPSSSGYGSCEFIWLATEDAIQSGGTQNLNTTETFTLFNKYTGMIIATNIPFVKNISFNVKDTRGDDINAGVDIAGYYENTWKGNYMLFRIKNNPMFLAGNTYNIGIASSLYGQCIDSPLDLAYSSAQVSLPQPFYPIRLDTLNYTDLAGRLILIWNQPNYDTAQNLVYDVVLLGNTIDTVTAITNQPFDIDQIKAAPLSASVPERAGYIDANGTLWMLYRRSIFVGTSDISIKCRVSAQSVNYYNPVFHNIPITNITTFTNNSNVITFNQGLAPSPPSLLPVKISTISPILNSPFDVSLWKSNTVYYPSTTNAAGFVNVTGTLWMLYRIQNQALLATSGNINTIQITTNLPDSSKINSNIVTIITPEVKPAPTAAYMCGESTPSSAFTLPSTLIAKSSPEIVLMWTQVSTIGAEPHSYIVFDTISNTILATVAPVYNIPFDLGRFSLEPFQSNTNIDIAGVKVVDGNVLASMLFRIKNNPLFTGGRSYNLVVKTVGHSYKLATSNSVSVTLVDNLNPPVIYSDDNGLLPTNLASQTGAEAVFIWSQYLPDASSLGAIQKFRISKSFGAMIEPYMIEEVTPVTNASFDLNIWKNGAFTRDTTTNTLGYIDIPTKTLWMMHRCKMLEPVYEQNIVIQAVSSSSQTNTSNVVTVTLPYYTDLTPTLYNVDGVLPSNFISTSSLEAIFIWSQPLPSASITNISSYNLVNSQGNIIESIPPVISSAFDVEAWKTQPYTTDTATNKLGIIINNTHWMMYRVKRDNSQYNESFNAKNTYSISLQTTYKGNAPFRLSNSVNITIPRLPYSPVTLYGLTDVIAIDPALTTISPASISAQDKRKPVSISKGASLRENANAFAGRIVNIYSSSSIYTSVGPADIWSYYFTNELTIPFIKNFMLNNMLREPGYYTRDSSGNRVYVSYGDNPEMPYVSAPNLYWRKCLTNIPYTLPSAPYNVNNIPGSVLYIMNNIPDNEPTVPSPDTVYDNYAFISAQRIGVGGLPTLGAGAEADAGMRANLPVCVKRFYNENAKSPALVKAAPGVYFTENGSMLGLLSPYNYDVANGMTMTVPAEYTTIVPNRFPSIPLTKIILPSMPLNHPGILSPNAYYRDNSPLPVYSPVNYPGGGRDVGYEPGGIAMIDPVLDTVLLPPCDIQYFNGHYGFNGSKIALNSVDTMLTTDVLPIFELVDVGYYMKDATSFVNTLEDGQLFSYGGVTYSNNRGLFPTLISVDRSVINVFSSYQFSNNMFQNTPTITHVGILDYNGQNSVNTVAAYAFNDCTNLVTIDSRFKFTNIQDYAFAGCTSFKGNNVVSPTVTKLSLVTTSDTTIGRGAFRGCTALTDVTVSSGGGALNISSGAFAGCSAVTKIEIRSTGDLNIDIGLFEGCTALTTLTIACTGNMSIIADAFAGCSALQSITLNAGSLDIVTNTFKGLTALTSVTMNSTSSITLASSIFTECTALTSVSVIAKGALHVVTGSFAECTGLTSITADIGSVSLPQNTFQLCEALTTVSLKCKTTLNVESGVFTGCSMLSNVTLDAHTIIVDASSFATNTNIRNFTLKGANIQSNDNTNLNRLILPFVASLYTIRIEGPMTLEFSTVTPIPNLQSLWIDITNLIINCGSNDSIFNNQPTLHTVYAKNISTINVALRPAKNVVLFNNCTNLRSVTVGSTYECNYTFSLDNYSNLTTVSIDTPNLAVNSATLSNSSLTNLSLKTVSRFGANTNIDINAELVQSRATLTWLSLDLADASFSFVSSLQQFTKLTYVHIDGANVTANNPASFFVESSSYNAGVAAERILWAAAAAALLTAFNAVPRMFGAAVSNDLGGGINAAITLEGAASEDAAYLSRKASILGITTQMTAMIAADTALTNAKKIGSNRITNLLLPGSFMPSVTNAEFFSALSGLLTFTNISSSMSQNIQSLAVNSINAIKFIFTNDVTSANIRTVLQFFIGKQIQIELVLQPLFPSTVYNIAADDLVSNTYIKITANVNITNKVQNTANLLLNSNSWRTFSTVIINGNVTMADRSFENLFKGLKLIINGNATIGDNCFSQPKNKNLQTSVTTKWFPLGILSFTCTGRANIGTEAFLDAIGLTGVFILSGSIGDRAFMNSGITSISTLDKTIGTAAFFGCELLTSLTMKEGLTSVGDFAFVNTGITGELVFPSTIVSLGRSYLVKCPNLTKVTYNCPVVMYKDPTVVYSDIHDLIALPQFPSVDIYISAEEAAVDIGGDNRTFTYKKTDNTSITVPTSALYININIINFKNRINAYETLIVHLKALYKKFNSLSLLKYSERPLGKLYTYNTGFTIQVNLSDDELGILIEKIEDAISSAVVEADSAIKIYDCLVIDEAPISALASLLPPGQEFSQLYSNITVALAACVSVNKTIVSKTPNSNTISVSSQYDMPSNAVITKTATIPGTLFTYKLSNTSRVEFTYTCAGSNINSIVTDEYIGDTTMKTDLFGDTFIIYSGHSIQIDMDNNDSDDDNTVIQINEGTASIKLSSLINPNTAAVICYLYNIMNGTIVDDDGNITSNIITYSIDYTFNGYVTSIKSLMNCQDSSIKIKSDTVYLHKMSMSGHTNTYIDISSIALVMDDNTFMSIDNSVITLNIDSEPVVGTGVFMDSTAFRLITNKDLINIPLNPIFYDMNSHTVQNIPELLPTITGVPAGDITDVNIETIVHGTSINNPIFAITFKRISSMREYTVISQPQDWFWCYLLNAFKSNPIEGYNSLSDWHKPAFTNALNHYQYVDESNTGRQIHYNDGVDWYSNTPYNTGLANNFAVGSFAYKGRVYNRTTGTNEGSNVRLRAVFSTLRAAYDSSWKQYGMEALEIFMLILEPLTMSIPGLGVAVSFAVSIPLRVLYYAAKAAIVAIKISMKLIGRIVSFASKFVSSVISKITTRFMGAAGRQIALKVTNFAGKNLKSIVTIGKGASKSVKGVSSAIKKSSNSIKKAGKCLTCTLGSIRSTRSGECSAAPAPSGVADDIAESISEILERTRASASKSSTTMSKVTRVITGPRPTAKPAAVVKTVEELKQISLQSFVSFQKKGKQFVTLVRVKSVGPSPTTFVTPAPKSLKTTSIEIAEEVSKTFSAKAIGRVDATGAVKASRLTRSTGQATRGLVPRAEVVEEIVSPVLTRVKLVPKPPLTKAPLRQMQALTRQVSGKKPPTTSKITPDLREDVAWRQDYWDPPELPTVPVDVDKSVFAYVTGKSPFAPMRPRPRGRTLERSDVETDDIGPIYTTIMNKYFSRSSPPFNIDEFKIELVELFVKYDAPFTLAQLLHILDYFIDNSDDSLKYLQSSLQLLSSTYNNCNTTLSQLASYTALTQTPLAAAMSEEGLNTSSILKIDTDIEAAFMSSIDAQTPPYLYPTASDSISFNSSFPANDFAYYATAGCNNQPDVFNTNNLSEKNCTLNYANPLMNINGYMFNGVYLDRETGTGTGPIGSDGVVDVISQEGANSGAGGYENQQLLYNKWFHIYLGKRNVSYSANQSSYANHAFSGALGMNLVIPEGVTDISDYAYCATDGIDGVVPFVIISVTFPSTLKTIGKYAFANTHIETCNIPQNVKSIGVGAFKNSKLTSVHFGWIPLEARGIRSRDAEPTGTSLGNNAFDGCSLATINLAGIDSVGVNTFNGNPIEEVKFGDSLPDIHESFATLIEEQEPIITTAPEIANDINEFLKEYNIDIDVAVDPTLSATASNGGFMVYTWAFIQSIINNTPTPDAKYVSWLPGGVAPGNTMFEFQGETLTVNNSDSTPQYIFSRVQDLGGLDVSNVSVENTDQAQYKTGWICTLSDNGVVPIL